MGISLNGLTPAGTYPGLIKTGDNTAIDGTPKVLSDGNGNNLPMEVSTTGVNFTNNLQQGGVAVPTASQVAAKQDTLVSGTNIKTINSTSILGSGNINVVTSPSGVSGAIQFSNGSAFASDASNLFWDDTNNRLGVGTNAPTATAHFRGIGTSSATTSLLIQNSAGNSALQVRDDNNVFVINNNSDAVFNVSNGSNFGLSIFGFQNSPVIGSFSSIAFGQYGTSKTQGALTSTTMFVDVANRNVGIGTTSPSARTHIVGSGSTSATTSLLVQNSAGTELFRVYDNTGIVGAGARFGDVIVGNYVFNGTNIREISVNANALVMQATQGTGVVMGTTTLDASAFLQVNSTTRGFLPPRMTTTQKNAIASPAAGLVVYDSTTNKLCCYNGSTWNDLF